MVGNGAYGTFDWLARHKKDKRIFVFGSNNQGRHGKGAALWAKQNRGAIYGQAEGFQGQSYAIPTMFGQIHPLPLNPKPIPLNIIQGNVWVFLQFAVNHPELRFQVTPIGCGLAGYKPEQIAPMFLIKPYTDNTGSVDLVNGVLTNLDMPIEFKRVYEQ